MRLEPRIELDRTDDLIPDTSTMCSAFDDLKSDILIRLGSSVTFEVSLILEVMKKSASDGAEHYFLGHMFEYHCYLLGLDYEDLLEIIVSKGLIKRKNTLKIIETYTEELKDEIRSKYSSGEYTQRMLCDEYNIGDFHLKTMVKGVPHKYCKKRSVTFHQDVIDLRLAKLTIKQIARKLHVKHGTVSEILTPLGLNRKFKTKNKYYLI